jgi:secreted trypsin-like serine protease
LDQQTAAGENKVKPNGDGRGGTCSGDSGGPVFLGGSDSNLIVAVTSFGLNALCRGTDFSYRVDRAEVLDWINSH